ncbi:MAG: histidinol dehydrogenase [Methylacidiphilales bacterium]|nr:histidinol dehydrogenase [Candidatus Methylacidiphilales bacterium]
MKYLSYEQSDFSARVAELKRMSDTPPEVVLQVRQILNRVQKEGDRAVVEITNQFASTSVTREQLALTSKPPAPKSEIKEALRKAHRNIVKFYRPCLPKSWLGKNHEGAQVGEIYQPLERVGIYVPGGTAPLVSSALMTITLAKTAGVESIVVCTPPPVNPVLHYAIKLAGATEIYQVGGAQAIAAMAYGTESIKAVHKVYGPGNAFVVEAKRQIFGRVGVDLIPGPSEVAVLADKSAKPAFVAADLLAQAEHGPGSQIFLISTEKKLIEAVKEEIERQIVAHPRIQYLRETLNLGCTLLLVKNLKQGVQIVEAIAPEHLSLVCAGAKDLGKKIRNCGGIFIGDYSPVAAGDYAAGPSHEYPTNGSARSFSGLTIDQFVRKTSFVRYEKDALKRGRKTIETLAEVEGMTAHKASVAVRFAKK